MFLKAYFWSSVCVNIALVFISSLLHSISPKNLFFPERNSWKCSSCFSDPWNNYSENIYKAILYISISFAPFCCDQQGLKCCLLCQEKRNHKPNTQAEHHMNIFFLMNLAKIPILCFAWQTALKSDSGNICFYPFIQLLPCIRHSFSHFFR